MKISKYTILPVAISIVLFLIPFFWFKPGEMDLGGDSSRLYFYDPASYLSNAALYAVSPSNFGAENLGYANLPFIFLLLILKSIVISPTILICMFYGISLSGAFLFTYLSIKELVGIKSSWLVAAIGGLVYAFSPSTLDGWKHVLITYNHIFLSPLIFYLLLRYFKTSNVKYILVTILLTFVFSPNFSVSAAPSIFAFYPLSIAFLALYTKLILKRHIVVKHIVLGLLLFMGIQAFHLLPTIRGIFSSGSDINSTVFTDKGKFDRGLSYFSAIVPNIKASLNLFGLPQMTSLSLFSKVFIAFPFVIVIAFLFNKKKTILLTAVFFLIALFFATANVTNTWLFIYKWLFNVPGFSMFRNFHGQWLYVYIFFYAILFGQVLYIVLNKLSRTYGRLLIFLIAILLVVNAMPLIKGNIANEVLWQSNNIKAVIKMDPDFEKVLSYIKALPANARVLTLPLTDPGYQIVSGSNGGAYMGSSIIAFLAGKKDFGSYDEFQDYKDLIPELIKNNELEKLKGILGILNIKYVFYNADPIVYNAFPNYPYQHVKEILPATQESYKKLIKNLSLKEIKNINNKFFVFELQDDYFLPQIYAAKKLLHFNKSITDIQTQLSADKDNRIAVYNRGNIPINPTITFNDFLVDKSSSSFMDLITSTDRSKFGLPYVSWKMSSFVYPFVVLREKRELAGYKEVNQKYIDGSIFLAEKRVVELERWRDETLILGNVKSIDLLNKSWQEPNIVSAVLFKKYNFWEISLLRYQRAIYDLIDKIEKVSESDSYFIINKDRVRKAVGNDMEVLYRIIQNAQYLPENQKIYLLSLTMDMFNSITNRLQFKMQSLREITYNFELDAGNYEMLIDNISVQDYNQSEIQAIVNDKELSFDDFKPKEDWFRAQNVSIENKAQKTLKLLLPEAINLILDTKWELVEKGNFATSSATLTVNDAFAEKFGLIRQIANWNKRAYYVVSFDYITYGKGFKFLLFDKRGKQNQSILVDYLRSNEWKKYKSIVVSSDETSAAFLQIIRQQGGGIFDKIEPQGQPTKIDIKNLSIAQIPNPKIIFRKVKITNDRNSIPNITFTRINPTKYELKVRNAYASYTLVLMNQFNNKWRLVDPNKNTSTTKASFSRLLANIGKTIVGILWKESENNKNMNLAYFDGYINEKVGHDIFLNQKTFETWGKNEIAEYKHFPVNGYANAWYIEPADVGNKTDYELIIEMSSQKLFYVGLFISISTVVLALLLTIKFFKK